MVIWHFPGAKGTLAIAIVAGIAAGIGYLSGGDATVWAAVTFVALYVMGWLWSTMETYTENS
jgi:hypothetical protein